MQPKQTPIIQYNRISKLENNVYYRFFNPIVFDTVTIQVISTYKTQIYQFSQETLFCFRGILFRQQKQLDIQKQCTMNEKSN